MAIRRAWVVVDEGGYPEDAMWTTRQLADAAAVALNENGLEAHVIPVTWHWPPKRSPKRKGKK